MVNAEGEPGYSLPPTEKTGKQQQEIRRNIYLTLEEDLLKKDCQITEVFLRIESNLVRYRASMSH